MCQSCFVSQGAIHIHGQQAFSCPELDELDEDDEGDEGDENDFDLINEYLASLGAGEGGEEVEDEDHSLDDLSFRFVDDAGDDARAFPTQPQESIRLADENGPLERITSAEAAKLEAEETSIKQLFPKLTPSIPSPAPKTKKLRKKKSQGLPEVKQKPKKKRDATGPSQATSPKQKTKNHSESATLPKKTSKVQKAEAASLDPQKLLKKKKKKKKKNAENGVPLIQSTPPKKQKHANGSSSIRAVTTSLPPVFVDAEEEAPLRLLQKILADSNPSFASPTKKSPHKSEQGEVSPHLTGKESQSKKRARANGSSPKLKKQKLVPTFGDQDF